MKKLMFISLLSLVTINYSSAEEYISDEYFSEITTLSEVMNESNGSIEPLPITKTIEDEVREEEEKNLEELIVPLLPKAIPLMVKEEQKPVTEEPVSNTFLEGFIQRITKKETKDIRTSLAYEDALAQAKSNYAYDSINTL